MIQNGECGRRPGTPATCDTGCCGRDGCRCGGVDALLDPQGPAACSASASRAPMILIRIAPRSRGTDRQGPLQPRRKPKTLPLRRPHHLPCLSLPAIVWHDPLTSRLAQHGGRFSLQRPAPAFHPLRVGSIAAETSARGVMPELPRLACAAALHGELGLEILESFASVSYGNTRTRFISVSNPLDEQFLAFPGRTCRSRPRAWVSLLVGRRTGVCLVLERFSVSKEPMEAGLAVVQ